MQWTDKIKRTAKRGDNDALHAYMPSGYVWRSSGGLVCRKAVVAAMVKVKLFAKLDQEHLPKKWVLPIFVYLVRTAFMTAERTM